MTLSFVRSDKPVYTTVSIRPFSPCHRTQAMVGSTVSHMSGIPIRPLQSEFTIFTDASTQGCGSHIGDSQILVVWTCSERKLHIIVLELMAVILAFQHWVAVLQGHQVMIATDNTTVVPYINKQGGTHSHTLLRLVVDLLLWLQSQDIADQLSRPNQPITSEWRPHPK